MRDAGNLAVVAGTREVFEPGIAVRVHAGGGKVTITKQHNYVSFVVALCDGAITCIGRLCADGKPMDLTGVTWRWDRGNEVQSQAPFISAKLGAPLTSACRGTAYIVFDDLNRSIFGDRLPKINFKVFRPLANPETAEGLIRAVNIDPAALKDGVLAIDGLRFR